MTAIQTRAVPGLAPSPVGRAVPVRGTDEGHDAVDLVSLPTGSDRAANRWHVPRSVVRLGGVVALVALWEIASRAGWISKRQLAAPSTVFTAGWDLIRAGTLQTALWASLQRVLWGLAFGVPIGAGLALVAGLSRIGDSLVDANVQMLRFVPIIALQPLLVYWLGIGETVKIVLIVIGVAFPIYVNTSAAIRSVHPGYHELAEVVELGRVQTIRKVVLPGALPGFLVGLRLSLAIAWLLLVFAEQINAKSGLGYMMIRAQTFFQTDILLVGLVVYLVLGLISDFLARSLERGLLRWQAGR
ncbi:MAG: binding-protein-dependent transport system inner rane component [Ilumatobacteraceae bacterium]|nr:binding-protein-dependent transport system inner rane component [Ilumatobacteraceae bacterium]MCU1391267.1 binding-protein-dependent transport system inner rane component [Ilumatobacteraceae bacterium]